MQKQAVTKVTACAIIFQLNNTLRRTFIGYHLSKQLLEYDCTVIGYDNLNDYYEVQLKYDR